MNGNGNGGCCIARWTDQGHVSHDYDDVSKMDMIMLKFRPIAPKPTVSLPANNNHPHEGRLPKTASRGRRKTTKNNNNNGKKRKSSSPDNNNNNNQDQKRDVTLLPLFPEAPDLSPSAATQANTVPIWLNFENSVSINNNGFSNVYPNNNNYCGRSGW